MVQDMRSVGNGVSLLIESSFVVATADKRVSVPMIESVLD